MNIFRRCYNYLSESSENLDKDKIINFINEIPEETDIEEAIMTLAQQWMEEGEIKGRQEGELKGRQEGEIKGRQEGELKIVLKQLQLKFGKGILDYKVKLENCSIEQLDLMGERVLFCDSLEAVFDGIIE